METWVYVHHWTPDGYLSPRENNDYYLSDDNENEIPFVEFFIETFRLIDTAVNELSHSTIDWYFSHGEPNILSIYMYIVIPLHSILLKFLYFKIRLNEWRYFFELFVIFFDLLPERR